MRLATEKDAELYEKRQAFLNKHFNKTYALHGPNGFLSFENPPRKNDALIQRLTENWFGFGGRLFEPENTWYFSKEFLRHHDERYDRFFHSEIDLRRIAEIYHSPEEVFRIRARQDFRVNRETPWISFAGYSLFCFSCNGEIMELMDGAQIIKADVKLNSRSFYLLKGSEIAVTIPSAMVVKREFQRQIIYEIQNLIPGDNTKREWFIQPMH